MIKDPTFSDRLYPTATTLPVLNGRLRTHPNFFNPLSEVLSFNFLISFLQEEVEIKRDTERQDEIRAMKQAWEAAEPGRAAKAQAAREKFLKEHLIKMETEEEGEEKAELEGEGKTPEKITLKGCFICDTKPGVDFTKKLGLVLT